MQGFVLPGLYSVWMLPSGVYSFLSNFAILDKMATSHAVNHISNLGYELVPKIFKTVAVLLSSYSILHQAPAPTITCRNAKHTVCSYEAVQQLSLRYCITNRKSSKSTGRRV